MQCSDGLIEHFKDNVVYIFLIHVFHFLVCGHCTFYVFQWNGSISVCLHRDQECVVDTGHIERIVIAFFSAEPECFDQLTVFFYSAVIVEVLPASFGPSVVITVGRRVGHESANVVGKVSSVDVMSQVGRNLIIIIQSFVSQVGEHRTDGAFRALKAFQCTGCQFVVDIDSVRCGTDYFRIVYRCVGIGIHFFEIITCSQS